MDRPIKITNAITGLYKLFGFTSADEVIKITVNDTDSIFTQRGDVVYFQNTEITQDINVIVSFRDVYNGNLYYMSVKNQNKIVDTINGLIDIVNILEENINKNTNNINNLSITKGAGTQITDINGNIVTAMKVGDSTQMPILGEVQGTAYEGNKGKALEQNKLDKSAMQNSHSGSTTEPYSANQTNNEIIDSFKYNFRQLIPIVTTPLTNNRGTLINLNNGSYSFSYINSGDYEYTRLFQDSNFRDLTFTANHKYYFNVNAISSKDKVDYRIFIQNNDDTFHSNTIYTPIKDGKFVQLILGVDMVNKNIEDIISPILIDLTEMFGAGNEPSTVEEVQQYLVPNKYYPYGKNIEPSMYVAKGEVNGKMMGAPSDTADNIPLTKFPLEYYAPANGYFMANIYYDNGGYLQRNVQGRHKQFYIPITRAYHISGNVFIYSVFQPMAKGDYIELYSDGNTFGKDSSIKFVYAKEL